MLFNRVWVDQRFMYSLIGTMMRYYDDIGPASVSDSPQYDRLLHALIMELAYLKFSGHVGSQFVLVARWRGDSKILRLRCSSCTQELSQLHN